MLRKKIKRIPAAILARREYWRYRGQRELKKYSDYEFVTMLYEKHGRKLNLANPERFTEKLQWLKLFWRDELATTCSDKYAVRSYLEEQGYGELLNELIAVYEDVDSFDPSRLPDRFVLKAAHGSGWNLIVRDKSKVNWFWWKKIMRSWMKQNLYWFGREWNYKNQKPRLIVEKYLEDSSGELRDYKIFCMNGKPRFIRFDENRATNHKYIYTDCEGNPLPIKGAHSTQISVNFGSVQRQMLRIAESLSKPFPHVRVDFYECGGKIYFGELTFFHDSGFYGFEPDEWDYKIGQMLSLPEPNYNLELYHQLTEKQT